MAWANVLPARPRGGPNRFGDGAMSMLTRWAKTAFLSGLGGVTGGTLTVECPDRTYRFGESGELDATLTVHDERFFLRALTGHDIGLGESFMDGDWTTPQLVPFGAADAAQPAAARRTESPDWRCAGWRAASPGASGTTPSPAAAGTSTALRSRQQVLPTVSRRRALMYSCALLRVSRDSLEAAQVHKVG